MKQHTPLPHLLLPLFVLAIPLPAPAAEPGPHARKTTQLIEPWLDPDKAPRSGTDSNVADFVRETIPAIHAAVPAALSAPAAPNRKVLVLTTDTAGALHVPGAAALLHLLRHTAKTTGKFQFDEAFSVDDIPKDKLAEYDAVVLNNISQVARPDHAAFYNEVLPDYVRKGGGILATHGSGLPFRKNPDAEYNRMLGGFVTENPVHPGKAAANFSTTLPDPEHPLAAGFLLPTASIESKGQWLSGKNRKLFKVKFETPEQFSDELYTFNPLSNADEASKVVVAIDAKKLAQGGPEYPKDTQPFGYALAWYKSYGQGRVYYTQFGHNFSIYSVPHIARSVVDALQFACGDLGQ